MEFLDLHRFLLDNEILMMDGILPEWDYKNIVTVALRADELNWAEEFIRNYREKLPEFVRDNAFNYNLAAFYFAAKDYKMALQLLQQVNFTDESYQLGSKIIQLKSYYELGEWETGISLISAFRQLVERSKSLSEYRKLSNLNMLKLAKKIISLSQDWDFLTDSAQRKGIENLEEALKKYQPQANLDWLMEKIEALKN
jgi:tetratricopeptide (TPR) repeat protein